MNDSQQTLSTIENDFSEIATLVNEVAYDKFSNGELSAEQLRELYEALRRWAQELEHFIIVLKICNKSTIITSK